MSAEYYAALEFRAAIDTLTTEFESYGETWRSLDRSLKLIAALAVMHTFSTGPLSNAIIRDLQQGENPIRRLRTKAETEDEKLDTPPLS